jgi:hypothetical protein
VITLARDGTDAPANAVMPTTPAVTAAVIVPVTGAILDRFICGSSCDNVVAGMSPASASI